MVAAGRVAVSRGRYREAVAHFDACLALFNHGEYLPPADGPSTGKEGTRPSGGGGPATRGLQRQGSGVFSGRGSGAERDDALLCDVLVWLAQVHSPFPS